MIASIMWKMRLNVIYNRVKKQSNSIFYKNEQNIYSEIKGDLSKWR